MIEAYARSSAGQSGGFLNRRSEVRVLSGVVDDATMNGEAEMCQETTQAAKPTIDAGCDVGPSSPHENPVSVPCDDSSDTHAVPCFDKPDDKQDDKKTPQESTLSEVLGAWPALPEPVKAGILALIRACLQKENQ